MVVGLHLHQHVPQRGLGGIGAGLGWISRRERLHGVPRHHRRVVGIRDHRVCRLQTMGVANHAKQALVL